MSLSFMNFYWRLLKGDDLYLQNVSFKGPQHILPSIYDVTTFASEIVAVASLAAAELKSARSSNKKISQVEVDRLEACAAFKGESLLKPLGWNLPPLWDPVAGDYKARDTWIRLHTNYKNHLKAVLSVLKVSPSREEVAKKVLEWESDRLESEVIKAGGCAAAMKDASSWRDSLQGQSTRNELPVVLEKGTRSPCRFGEVSASDGALTGIRVLDLTRVIAGPECTRFLSAHGADVLRLDPPGFEEVPALIPEVTVGKRCAFLDITSEDGKKTFEELIKKAHVLVHGLRPGVLESWGFSKEKLMILNPSLIVATLNAYGWSGPWRERRGFDSLVQMSCGITSAGAAARGLDKPVPLPVQALDHGAGYLLAAGICRALTELYLSKTSSYVRSSLIGLANTLMAGPADDIHRVAPDNSYFDSCLIHDESAWGPLMRVRLPGKIDGEYAHWRLAAGPLGAAKPVF